MAERSIFMRGSKEDYALIGMRLGLSIVTKIIKNMDGEILVDDRVKGVHSKGSNFILLLPKVV